MTGRPTASGSAHWSVIEKGLAMTTQRAPDTSHSPIETKALPDNELDRVSGGVPRPGWRQPVHNKIPLDPSLQPQGAD
jgi:hypothetical protein